MRWALNATEREQEHALNNMQPTMKDRNLRMPAQQPCRKKHSTLKKVVQRDVHVVAAEGAYAPVT